MQNYTKNSGKYIKTIIILRVQAIKNFYKLGNAFTSKRYGKLHFTATDVIVDHLKKSHL